MVTFAMGTVVSLWVFYAFMCNMDFKKVLNLHQPTVFMIVSLGMNSLFGSVCGIRFCRAGSAVCRIPTLPNERIQNGFHISTSYRNDTGCD
jgi:hypothetical protein